MVGPGNEQAGDGAGRSLAAAGPPPQPLGDVRVCDVPVGDEAPQETASTRQARAPTIGPAILALDLRSGAAPAVSLILAAPPDRMSPPARPRIGSPTARVKGRPGR
jgi:hypothetical protein